MNTGSLGDLSQSYLLRHRNTSLKQDIARLTQELATGQVADVRQVLAGNVSYLADIERKTAMLEGYKVATSEATHFAGAMQTALGRFSDLSEDLTSSLVTAGLTTSGSTGDDIPSEARNALSAMIGTLNTDIAGRYMFSGTATNQAPLVEPDILLADLSAAIATATTPADMLTQAKAWFDDPAGFSAMAYQGSADVLLPFGLSQTEEISLHLQATDPKLRAMLAATAVAALADDPSFALSLPDQSEVFRLTGASMLGDKDGVTELRANVGFVESRIEAIATRNAAEVSSLNFARTNLLEVDPYTAATQLEDVQFQLQSLYSVTVRSSQLSLVNFL